METSTEPVAPASICSIVNSLYRHELAVMLYSHFLQSDAPAYIVCDELTKDFVDSLFPSRPVFCQPTLGDSAPDVFRGGDPSDPDYIIEFSRLLSQKPRAIAAALAEHPNTLFADADVVFFERPFDIAPSHGEVILSPQYNLGDSTAIFGRYNAGYLAVADAEFARWWSAAQKGRGYYDQKCLDEVPAHFRITEAPETHNFAWWNLGQDPAHEIKGFTAHADGILLRGKPLVSVHSHFVAPCRVEWANSVMTEFNRFLIGSLRGSREDHRDLAEFIGEMRRQRLAADLSRPSETSTSNQRLPSTRTSGDPRSIDS